MTRPGAVVNQDVARAAWISWWKGTDIRWLC